MSLSSTLLGLAAGGRPPLAEVAEHLGWAVFGLVTLVIVWAWTRGESLRRSLLALEDPRTMALLRIGLALVTIQTFWNLEPYSRLLLSDEGVVPMDVARARLGNAALTGWSPSEGFFDLASWVRFFTGRYSFFFLESSPSFVTAYMYGFFGVLILYAAGVASRVTGVVSMVMMCSILNRNPIHAGGMDDVLRVFWLLVILGRTGHAWSFDNWLRCRILRRRGALAEADAAPEVAAGKAPIYRLIPAWPRYLMMLQLAVIYVQTGAVKTGAAWKSGDALYYALNQDIYYRFEGLTQAMSALFATNLFRAMTYVTRGWEVGFGVLLLGMILKFGLDHRGEPWYQAMEARRGRLWLGRAALLVAYAIAYYINVVGYPYRVSRPEGASEAAIEAEIAAGLPTIHMVYGLLIPAAVVLWFTVRRRPLTLWRGGALAGRRLGPLVVDQGWLRRWFLGRRVWLGLGLCFHGILLLFLNLGSFPTVMLATYVAWLSGAEIVAGLRWLLGQLRRRRWSRALAPARADALCAPAEAAEAIPLRRRLPDALVLAAAAIGVGLVAYRASGGAPAAALRPYVYAWIGGAVVIAAIVRVVGGRSMAADRWQGGPPLAYGALGRTLALAFVLWHGGSMAMVAAPSYQVLGRWRLAMYGLFDEWITVTGTDQSWTMFAPSPAQVNLYLSEVVVQPDGQRFEVRGLVREQGPVRLRYDRVRRMKHAMLTKKRAQARAWAELQCREWALARGVWPVEIELHRRATAIPPPEEVAAKGPIYREQLKEVGSRVDRFPCPPGGLPYFMKERYGLPISDEDRAAAAVEAERQRREDERKRQAWEARRGIFGPG
ncbi:MAG: hypothetical protein H6710_06240 [Myxococcales bacterium]|nr:hypothetical protein [Myxococcales bacterium]